MGGLDSDMLSSWSGQSQQRAECCDGCSVLEDGSRAPSTSLRFEGLLGEAEDNELGRLGRSHPDLDDQLADVAGRRRVVLPVALDVKRLALRRAEEGARAP